VLVECTGAWALGEGVACDLKGQWLGPGLGQMVAPLRFGFFDGKAFVWGVHVVPVFTMSS
jgi:hypothetical protein